MIGYRSGRWAVAAALLAAAVMFAVTPAAAKAKFQVLYTFTNGEDGDGPAGKLSYADGVLYGTTTGGNGPNAGSVFSYDIETNEFTPLYDFSGGEDGGDPIAGVVVKGGILYGSTNGGGAGFGTLYALDLDQAEFQTLQTFSGEDGASPTGTLLLKKGVIFGTTSEGGVTTGCNNLGCGTVFSYDLKNNLFDSFYQFPADATSGWFPGAGVTYAKGVLYGTASTGGINGGQLAYGTVFAVEGADFTLLHTFDGIDGASPEGAMVYKKGMLYGTTLGGGNGCAGGCGTIFEIDPKSGAFQTLHQFNQTDGRSPRGGLVYRKGKIYGTTIGGGTGSACKAGCGTVYQFDIATGTVTTLYSFSGGADGWNPLAGLVYVKGTLYGTTALGGSGYGVLFSVKP